VGILGYIVERNRTIVHVLNVEHQLPSIVKKRKTVREDDANENI
jgi:hypothetical protein